MNYGLIDTSVLAGFSGIGRLDVLWGVFPRVAIVPEVYREIVTDGEGWTQAAPAQTAIDEALHFTRVSAPAPHPNTLDFPRSLGAGEIQVIEFALENGIPALIDDRRARSAAIEAGAIVVGTLGILGRAKSVGELFETKPLIMALRGSGIRFGDELIERFLRKMKEI